MPRGRRPDPEEAADIMRNLREFLYPAVAA